MRSRRVSWLASLLCLALATTSPAADLDDGTPMVCHTAKTASGAHRFARIPDVALGDVLSSGLVDVVRPRGLCAPAGIGSNPDDPKVHWERYRSRAHDRVPTAVSPNGLTVVTADDTYVVDVRRPTELLVPTAANANAPVAPLGDGHPTFQCYAAAIVSTTFRPGPITVDTGPGPGVTHLLRRAVRLCLGVEGAVAGPHLLCYAVSPGTRAVATRLHTHPVFGPEQLDRRSLQEVCVPALLDGVALPPSTTTTTATTVTTSTTLPGPSTTTTTSPGGSTTTTTTHPPVSGILLVPSQWPSIQAAVDVAAPGATIRIAAGEYHESIFVSGNKDGLTIEAADPAHPPEVIGVVGSKLDGIRADFIDDLTVRNLRIIGSYDAIRLNHCNDALLELLHLENSALGVRINNGEGHVLRDSTIDVTRVEQGIWIEYAPDTVLERLVVRGGQFGGIRIRNSDRVRLTDVDVDDSDGSDGIKVEYSPDARIEGCSARDGYARGFRIINCPDVVFTGNVATNNATAGIRIENSEPFATAADVLAAGNTATGNDPNVSVQP